MDPSKIFVWHRPGTPGVRSGPFSLRTSVVGRGERKWGKRRGGTRIKNLWGVHKSFISVKTLGILYLLPVLLPISRTYHPQVPVSVLDSSRSNISLDGLLSTLVQPIQSVRLRPSVPSSSVDFQPRLLNGLFSQQTSSIQTNPPTLFLLESKNVIRSTLNVSNLVTGNSKGTQSQHYIGH